MKISNDEIVCMRIFHDFTDVEPADCVLSGDGVAFLIPEGKMGKAIGRNGSNIQRLRSKMNRNVYLFEQLGDEEEFIRKAFNVSSPSIQEAEKNNKKVIFVKLSASDRYSMRRGAVITFAKRFFERLFGKELKIVSR